MPTFVPTLPEEAEVSERMLGAVCPPTSARTTGAFGIRTKRDLIARVEQRYSLPHEQALAAVEIWAAGKHFATWTA